MVAPEGWEVKLLKELFDFFGGFAASRAELSNKGYPYLHYGDIHNTTKTFFDVSDNSIPKLDITLQRISPNSLLNDGDVVFVDASEDEKGASRHVIVHNLKNEPFISGLHTIILKSKTDEVDKKFREFCFQSNSIKQQFKFYAVGTKVIGINKSNIAKIELLFPKNLSEQLRIAEVLSDTDLYITTLERLIAKKEAVKQGVMQELLTGKRRLPGFKSAWAEKRLENIVKVYDSLRIPVTEAQREKGSYPYYGANGILDYVKGYTHEGEFVLLAEDGANDLLNYPVIYVNGRVWVNNHTHVITGLAGIANTRFLSYALKIIRFQHLVVGGTRCKLNSSIMSKIIISIPPTLAEQTAIAEILSDIDAELSALKKKLEKIRLIKQGMMDALLTGKIRLPEDKPNVQFMQRKEQEEIPYAAEKMEEYTANHKKRNKHIDDAVMIAGIVNELYSQKYPLGRKKVQKCLYLLRRHQKRSTTEFKKKAAGPYADEIRYRGGEPIALSAQYIITQKGTKGTLFFKGTNIHQALNYIEQWNMQTDIQWLRERLKFKSVDTLELWATVDMAICDLENMQMPISLSSIKHLIATNEEWKKKLEKPLFNDANIIKAISELRTLFEYKSK